MVYSVLKASTGFTLMAFWAGINPANNPANINMPNAANTVIKSTLGLINMVSGEVDVPRNWFNIKITRVANMIPAMPAMMVKKTDSNKI